jgi:hypothetical protein
LEEVIKKQGDMIKDMQTKLACLEKRTGRLEKQKGAK